jgi:hypothetical protein
MGSTTHSYKLHLLPAERAARAELIVSNAFPEARIALGMALSMRILLVADPSLPVDMRDGIAQGAPDSAARLVELGLDECEAAELLDEARPYEAEVPSPM